MQCIHWLRIWAIAKIRGGRKFKDKDMRAKVRCSIIPQSPHPQISIKMEKSRKKRNTEKNRENTEILREKTSLEIILNLKRDFRNILKVF